MISSTFHRGALLAKALIRSGNLVILSGCVRWFRAVIIKLVFGQAPGSQDFARSDDLAAFCHCSFGVGLFIRWWVAQSAFRFFGHFGKVRFEFRVGAFPSRRFIILASACCQFRRFPFRQSGYSSFGSNGCFWGWLALVSGCFGKTNPTSHAADASPRSVLTLFLAHPVFLVLTTSPRGERR